MTPLDATHWQTADAMPEAPRRELVLAICCVGLLLMGLDITALNVALPSIGRELHTSISGAQWTIDAYSVALACLLMLAGSLGDRIGRRVVFQTGLAIFGVGSLACAFAPSLGWLVVFRIAQAVGGSVLAPVALSILTDTFTDPKDRSKAIGIWGGTFGISVATGHDQHRRQ
ncbi:hypothetical protein JMUB6875_31620 [Nocardia sp. JMUB6875]|uniref:MFS transporter n=1 Tax=Nocardia sp. JMUB6875 TaxID=3158170 RepID=UPI0032E7E03F